MPTVVFVSADGQNRTEAKAQTGESILSLAHRFDIEIEGACEGNMACSTCHVIVDPDFYDRLPEASEEEKDMLDFAMGLTRTSRLGCQIRVTEDLDGLAVRLPQETRNLLKF